ncbi:c-type cytochrome [Aquimarina agarilytica]|uniref:c-type cytochrome n=1 Tax=Aquimarina agarilytica TaxID=1087449 RepID=UPI000287D0D0|nr:c-type cytochrome [Aquimarina agarilytica]
MRQVKHRNSVSKLLLLGLAFLLTFSTTTTAFAQADAGKGKELFNSLCAACHKRYKKATGPALFGVTERHSTEWLYKWIKNSTALIASGDAEAIEIYEQYNKTPMNSFPQLSNADIDNILAYVMEPKAAPAPGAVPVGGAQKATDDSGSGSVNSWVLGLLAVVLLVLVGVLFMVNKTLRQFAKANNIDLPVKEERKPIWKAFIENQFLLLVSAVFLLLLSGYFVYGYLMQVGVDQGYEPVQPIHYSHRIHAGDNKIDCKYCHSSARVSKHSGIPSLNVCMNCHKSIGEVAEATQAEGLAEYGVDYNKQIQKLYKAVGWDADKQAYTGKTEPVKWVRIHNLPDFAYFNHSQHVMVAGVACQKCHGPVEEMEIMYQHAPLTMGWCINCHRETNVKVEGNAYYEKIHEELSKKYGVDKLTAAQMGGLECGKCHY